ncbi:extensin family protein [Rhizobium sp. SGZ-381]|uniref:extensin family protein n=1 Tax=Rhizobium sp. SGZ-381 TaxID=3342800 RepID=UPI003670A909
MAYAFSSRRAMAFLMISTMLVGCSADGLMPLESVDTGARVGSIRPLVPPASLPATPAEQGYAAAPQPMAQTYNQTQAAAGESPSGSVHAGASVPRQATDRPVVMGAPPTSLGTLTLSPAGHPTSAATAGKAAAGGDGVLPPVPESARVVGLAEEQDRDISGNTPSRPVAPARQVASVTPAGAVPSVGLGTGVTVSTRSGRITNAGASVAAVPRWSDQSPVVPPSRAEPEPEPEQVAMLMPRNPAGPMESPRMDAPVDGPMPASEIACRRELKRMGVEFRDKPRISDGPSCGIDYPVELSGLSGDIDVRPSVTLNCQTTLAFAKWVKNELAPSSRLRYFTSVKTIEPLGGYSCRRMNNSRQRYNPMSEHARGNAIDVGKFVLKNGHEIDVRKKGLFSFREGALLKAVRSDSCKYFNTVLGPGSNPEHWNHFHFDLRSRATGNRYCD